MNSSIFRRNSRKGCGCSRGGAMTELQQQEKNLAGLNKQLARANELHLTTGVRADLTRRRNAKKLRVNALKAVKQNTGILSAITNKVQNAVQGVKNNVTRTETAVTTANKTIQNAPQAAAAAEVAAATVAVNKSKNLAALANRAQALANNIRKTVGGKRRKHRRTHRK